MFLSFGTSTPSITENKAVTFTAVLTDPDGIDDLIGGSLTNADATIQYGAFATSGQEGAYSLALSWDAINQADAIMFKQSESRMFIAVFFDSTGHRVQATASLQLTCDGKLACEGHCRTDCDAQSMTAQSCDTICAEHDMTCEVDDLDRRAVYGVVASTTIRLMSCSEVPAASYQGQDLAVVVCSCVPLH